MDIKENLAKNLTACRKAFNLTQSELAEKLNYSDKAVSKWERGESVPDIVVLKQLSTFYGITIDKLLSENQPLRPKITKNLSKKRTLISLLSTALVWLVAILSFAIISILDVNFSPWLIFIYASVVNSIVFVVFASVWKNNFFNAIFISVLMWLILLSIYLTLLKVLPIIPANLWQIFLVGIPFQLMVGFWFVYRYVKKLK
jgi:transcriptional regulator with XRE-family HTH domain